MGVYDELKARGLIAQTTNEEKIRDLLNNDKITFYIGFDPTADSLHVGHFVQIMVMSWMQKAGHVPIALFGGGTGNPVVATATGAARRAAEIEADVILKATMVDGVYDSDPKKNPDAKKYDTLSYMDVLNQNLGVMDMTAASFCKDRNIPFLVFSIEDPHNIVRAVSGEKVGTLVQ